MRRISTQAVLAAAVFLFPGGADLWAQAPDGAAADQATLQDLQRQLERQSQELEEFRQRFGELLNEDEPEAEEPEPEPELEEPEIIDVGEEKFSVDVGGRILFSHTYGSDRGLQETFVGRDFENGHEFRQVRLFAEGEGFGLFDYKLQLDFADFNDPVAKDVYIGADSPIGYFRAGHFKHPFSVSQMTSRKYMTFQQRPLPLQLVSTRNFGMMLTDQWGPDGRNGMWAVSALWDEFQQDPTDDDGDVDNADEEFAGVNARITYLPYYDELSDGRYLLHTGLGFRHFEIDPDNDDDLRFRARPEVHDTFRLLGVRLPADADSYQMYGPEMAVVWGPASLQAEYILGDVHGGAGPELKGGYVFGSYFLTGENREYDVASGGFSRVSPLEHFWWVDAPGQACDWGLGAWEVAARFSWLDFDDAGLVPLGGADGTRGDLADLTLGLNWHWNPYMRVMFNYVHAHLEDAVTDETADLDMFVTRFQMDF